MAVYTYRDLKPPAEAEEAYEAWLAELDRAFTAHATYDERSEIVRDVLAEIWASHVSEKAGFHGRGHGLRMLHFDARNVTLEAEYYGDMDPERYYPRKPLIWLWLQFDASPLGANQWLGERLRQMLGRHIFAQMGERVRILSMCSSALGTTCRLAMTAGFIGMCCSMIAAGLCCMSGPV